MKKICPIALLFLFTLIISGCTLPWQKTDQVSCSMEAKLCPDGSAVGRSGSNCEFALCPGANQGQVITNFKECAAAGNPVMESYPRQCRVNGQTFTEILAKVGESCIQSADCQLPMDYAVRSNCPYQAYCYNQKCAVGCPSWQEKTNTWEVKCQVDKDCNCATWNEQTKYICACVDNQCASLVEGITQGNQIIDSSSRMDLEAAEYGCAQNNGAWVEPYNECENVSQDWCLKQDGTFKECESACRHDSQTQVCTLQCVPVCQFK